VYAEEDIAMDGHRPWLNMAAWCRRAAPPSAQKCCGGFVPADWYRVAILLAHAARRLGMVDQPAMAARSVRLALRLMCRKNKKIATHITDPDLCTGA
jgi:hypothetical protein